MYRGRFEKVPARKAFQWKWIIAIVSVILLSIILLCSNKPQLDGYESVEKDPDSIAIPGYEILQLKANSRQQSVCLPNPAQNVCYFRISLYLQDGTLLWESDLIKPGRVSAPIRLKYPLETGTYSGAMLQYACFKMNDELTPLNGAEMKLTLWVQ